MKTTKLSMSQEGYFLFKKYLDVAEDLEDLTFLSVLLDDNHTVDIKSISQLNELLRRASMTLEYVMANEVTEVEVEADPEDVVSVDNCK